MREVLSSATGPATRDSDAPGLRYNCRVPKRLCTRRAEWRLLRGQPAQHLSEHYRLDCDYDTALITIYNQGDPIFLCESHASTIGQTHDNCIAGVRLIGARSAGSDDPTKSDDRTQTPEPAAAKPIASTPPEPVHSSAAAKPVASAPSEPVSSPATAKPNASAPPETVASVAATKVGREIVVPSFRSPARDLTFGNSAKALVDETIWNMAPGDCEAYRTALQQGKSATEAAQAAGGQLAVVHRKIGEYTLKIEAILSESKATINVGDVIDNPLEHATLQIIGNSAMSEAEKDAAVDHLGALQEQINRGLDREITPLQAHRIARSIGDRASWGVNSCLSEELKPAYRAVYGSIRNAIRAAVPGARDLDERLANLYAAKCDLENVPAAKELQALPT
jgi:hypothetical protein